MLTARQFLTRHSLVIGIVLMFLLTWPVMFASSGVLPFNVPFILGLAAGWGVSIAALIMTAVTLGGKAVISLLRRFLLWRVSWRWYAVALLLYPAIQGTSVTIKTALAGVPPDFSTVVAHSIFGSAALLPIFVLPFFLTDAITNGEELGWRGYVLPRLQASHSALVSSLILGVIWALWHIPQFIAPGNTSPALMFLLKILADSVLYTWLYKNTRGSLLLATLFHASGNTGAVFLPVATSVSGTNAGTLPIQIALEILVAGIVVLTHGPARLSRTEPKQAQA